MRVASHDVRLYRLQLEEKVLMWFMDTWRPGGVVKGRLSPYVVEDILSLLRTVSNVARSADVISTLHLPKGIVVDAIIAEHDNSIIRDFLLHARLPLHQRQNTNSLEAVGVQPERNPVSSVGNILSLHELAVPRARERRISSYLLKSLDELTDHWEANSDNSLQFPAERVRTYLDLAVIALCFEGGLMQNGTQSNRRVLQAACKLLVLIVSPLQNRKWSEHEKGIILASLEPLILSTPLESTFSPWDTLLSPGLGTGIRFEMLHKTLQLNPRADARVRIGLRKELQYAIMQSSDVCPIR